MTAKQTRVTNVQVPGEAPPAPEHAAIETTTTDTQAQDDTAGHATSAPSDALDIEALRAQIRDEERAKARAELGAQIQAATSVLDDGAPLETASRGNTDYRNMRAVDVDQSKLTGPVLTLDGYVVPLPFTEKK